MFKASLDPGLDHPNLLVVSPAPKTRYHVVKWMDTQYGDMLRQYHELRKQVFVDSLHWELAVHDGMEWDQYDCPRAVYILIEEGGRCVGGCRMMRCDQRHNSGGVEYSYMLRDAHLGMLPGFPPGVIENPPTSADEWEMTRAICGRNPRQFRDLWYAMNDFVISQGGSYCTVISRPAVVRLASMWDFEINQMGPVTRIADADWLAIRFKKK